MPETIWVLEREDYRKLVDEQVEEDFQPSFGLPADKVPDLVSELMHELLPIPALRHDFEDRVRLRPLKEEQEREQEQEPVPPPQPRGLWPWEFIEQVVLGEALFPEDPVRWVTAKLLGIVNELQVSGFASPPRVEVTVDATEPAVTLTFELSLSEPISGALADSLSDEELGDLALIRRGANGAEVDRIKPEAHVVIACHLPTGDFPLEEEAQRQ